MADDFFLSFGSNAGDFARKLVADLTPANDMVERLAKNLKKVEGRGGGGAGVGGPSGGVGGANTPNPDELVRDFQRAGAELDKIVNDLARVHIALGNVPDLIRKQQEQINRSIGQLTAKRTDYYDPKTGRRVTEGTPGARAVETRPPPSAISQVTTAQIDDAAFTRVVNAVERTGERQVNAIDRLTAALNSGRLRVQGASGGGGGRKRNAGRSASDVESAVEEVAVGFEDAVKALTRAEVQAAKAAGQAVGRKKRSEIEAQVRRDLEVEFGDSGATGQRLPGETIAQRKERNRAAAQAVRAPRLEEAEVRRREEQKRLLALPGSGDFESLVGKGKGQLGKSQLVEIANAYRQQGYDVPYKGSNAKNTTVDELVRRLQSAFRTYEGFGRSTKEDLRTDGGSFKPDEISKAARKLVGELNDAIVEINQGLRREGELISENVLGGGDLTSWREGSKGRVGRGSSFGGVLDANITEAERRQTTLGGDLRNLATSRAEQLIGKRKFDPYTQDTFARGNDIETKATQAFISAVRRATTVLDIQGRETIKYNDQLKKAERALAAMTAAEEKASREGDVAGARDLQQRIPEVETRIAQLMERVAGKQQFLTPEYREGLERRSASRESFDARTTQMSERSVNQMLTRMSVRDAAGGALGGLRTAIGSRDLARLIPGLGFSGRKGFFSSDQSRDDRDFADITKEFRSFSSAITRRGELESPDGELDPSKIGKAQARAENKAEALLNAIEKVIGWAPAFTTLMDDIPERFRASELARSERREAVLGPGQATQTTAEREAQRVANFQSLPADKQKARLSAVQVQLARAQEEEERATREATKLRKKRAEQEAKLTKALQEQEANEGSIVPFASREKAVEAAREAVQAAQRLGYTQKLSQDDEAGYAPVRGPRSSRADRVGGDGSAVRGPFGSREPVLASAQRRLSDATRGTGVALIDPQVLQDADSAATTASQRVATLTERLQKLTSIAFGAATAEEKVSRETRRASESRKAAADTEERLTRKDLKVLRQAVHQDKGDEGARGALAAAEELYAAQRKSGGRGGRGGGSVPPTARGGDGEVGGPGSGGYLAQILQTLQQIHATLQAGIKTTGGARVERVASKTPGGGSSRAASGDARAFEGLAAAIQDTHPELARLVREERNAETAAQLVTAGILTQAQALRLFRNELKLDSDGVKNLNTELTNARIIARGGFAARRTQLSTQPTAEAYKLNESFDKRQVEQQQRSAAEDRRKARAQLELRAAMAQTGAETQRQIALLRTMNETGADNEQIVRQQAKVYDLLARDMAGAGSAQTKAAAHGIFNANRGGSPEISGGEVSEIRKTAGSLFGTVDSAAAGSVTPGGLFGEQSAFTQALFGNSGFWSRILNSTGTFLVRNFSAGFVFGLSNALQDVVQEAIITESTFIRVGEAMEATGKDVGDLRSQLQGISTEFGTRLNDVYEVAAGLTGLFDDKDQLAGATRVVSQLELISMGALSATEAMGVLASITAGYGSELEAEWGGALEGMEHVSDVLTVIQDNLGTNIEITSEGVGRMSGLAAALGLTFEQAAVYTGQIAKLTNQSGGSAGEQFSRILGAMQTGAGREAINTTFANTGAPDAILDGDYGQAIIEMSKAWDQLSEAQQNSVAVALGGQRQAASVRALFTDNAKILNTITKATYAKGQADTRSAELMKTLNAQIKLLTSNFQNLGNALVRTGLLNFIGAILMVTNKVLSTVNGVASAINDFVDSNPLLAWIKDTGFAIIGLVGAVALLGRVFRGFRETMRALPVVGANARAARSAETAATTLGGGRGAAATIGARTTSVFTSLGSASLPRTPSQYLGAGADRFIAGPTRAVGNTLARFGTALQASRDRILSEVSARDGVARSIRASVIGGAGTAVRGVGVGIGTLGYGAGATFRGQGGAFFGEASQALRSSGMRYGFQGDLAGMEGRRVAQLGNRGLSVAARAGARATDAVSTGLTKLSKSGMLAEGALTGLLVGFGLFVEGMRENAQLQKETQAAYDAFFGANRGGGGGKDDPDRYFGPATDIQRKLEDQYKNQNEFLVGLSAAPNYLAAALSSPLDATKDLFAIGGDNDRIAQEVSGQGENKYDYAAYLESYRSQLDATVGGGVEAVLGVQDGMQSEIDKMADEIINDPDLSSAQKATQLAELEQLTTLVADQVEGLILEARGIAEANRLTSDQVSRISNLSGLFQTLGGQSDLGGYRGGINSMVGAVGLSDDSDIRPILDRLAQGGLSDAEILVSQRDLLRYQIESTTASLQSKLDPESKAYNPEEAEALEQQLTQLLGQYDGAAEAIIGALVNQASLLGGAAASQGRFGDSLSAINAAIRGAQAEIPGITPGAPATTGFRTAGDGLQHGGTGSYDPLTDEDRARREAQLSQILQQRTQVRTAQKNNNDLRRKALSRNAVVDATADLEIARTTLQELRNAYRREGATGATLEQIQQARQQYFDALAAQADSVHQVDMARMAADAAGLWNDVAQANASEQQALAEMAYAREKFGANSTEYLNALASYRQSQQQVIQANEAETAAARETAIIRIAPGNEVAIARARLSAAQAAQSEAARYGTTSTQYQEATQQVIEAQRAVDDALNNIITANLNLRVAIADAAGQTIKAARIQLRAAQQELENALARSGGEETAEVINARAAVTQAEASLRDTRLQSKLDTIDFRLEMDRITADAAIAMLQDMLRTEDLTKQQRRDILLKIKGLRDGLRDELTGSGFNIADQIDLPTAYEVRRSLGIDPYLEKVRGYGSDVREAGELAGANTAARRNSRDLQLAFAGGGRDSDLGSVMRSVRDAVVANGAQVNQHIEVTNQVSRPEMINAIAKEVVRMIRHQTKTGARANSSRAKLVN